MIIFLTRSYINRFIISDFRFMNCYHSVGQIAANSFEDQMGNRPYLQTFRYQFVPIVCGRIPVLEPAAVIVLSTLIRTGNTVTKRWMVPLFQMYFPEDNVPCLMCKLCWKFHENPFICFAVMLLTDTGFLENREKETQYSRVWTWHPTNFPVFPFSFHHARPILKVSWKSNHAFSVILFTDK